jgi:hypothetical protein
MVECGGEQADDVLRSVREVVRTAASRSATSVDQVSSRTTDATNAAVVRDDAAAVVLDQAADELFGCLVDEGVLPGLEPDRPVVLSTGTVLGEEAGPVV